MTPREVAALAALNQAERQLYFTHEDERAALLPRLRALHLAEYLALDRDERAMLATRKVVWSWRWQLEKEANYDPDLDPPREEREFA